MGKNIAEMFKEISFLSLHLSFLVFKNPTTQQKKIKQFEIVAILRKNSIEYVVQKWGNFRIRRNIFFFKRNIKKKTMISKGLHSLLYF